MLRTLQNTFKCNLPVAKGLFDKLCSNLRIWTTTRRKDKVKVTIEDVYDALAVNYDKEHGEHELPYPVPFFKSRQEFANTVICNIKDKGQKVLWISGEPGSGKTSLLSYIQLNHKLFKARYHTFKPISPEQRFYDVDSGLSKPEFLWNDLLIQLRKYFKGELKKYNIPVTNSLCSVEQMRNEVIRLAQLLFNKTGEKVIICIDGIDHVARANNEITFLHSLLSPNEIPEGVVFVIVGQPAQLYYRFPIWLKNGTELENWNEKCLAWLERTGNQNVHNTTKKRPAEVHALEKQHLRPVSSLLSIESNLNNRITRTVHKDNVIKYIKPIFPAARNLPAKG
jgi:NADH:ubiquinone oxidoreductase subunit C